MIFNINGVIFLVIDRGNYKLYNGDCLEVMDDLIALGVKFDAIITEPLYGKITKTCEWDKIIPFNEMWIRLYKLKKVKVHQLYYLEINLSQVL